MEEFLGYDYNQTAEKLFAKSNGESIETHSKKAIEGYKERSEARQYKTHNASLEKLAKPLIITGLWFHDWGKFSLIFQEKVGNLEYINSLGTPGKEELKQLKMKLNGKNDNHEEISIFFLPPSLIDKIGETNFQLLLLAINNHHVRPKEKRLSDAQKIAIAKSIEKITGVEAYINNLMLLKDIMENFDDLPVKKQALYNLIAGEINYCDWYASDTNKDKEPIAIKAEHNGKYLCDYIQDAFYEKGYRLNKLQEYCRDNSDESLVMISSAGNGKTEAAAMWANNQPFIYTLPLQTSINAMSRRLQEETKYPANRINLMHSNSLKEILNGDYSEDNFNDALIQQQATRLFSYPYIITTIDQVLPFVYNYIGGERLLSNFAYTKIIIDELQSYEPELAAKVCLALKKIQDMGGKFLIITATMPQIFIEAMKKCGLKFKAPEPFLMDIDRHFISYKEADDFDYDYIKEMVSQGKKVLVICNTVKKAINTYKQIKAMDVPNTKCLHSNFCQIHRAQIEKYVVEFAKAGNDESGVFVSTQITEASLDIDFDVILTEMCGAANLIQRLARCHRRRELEENAPNVYIFNTRNGEGNVYDEKIFELSADYFRRNNNKIFTEKEKMELVKEVYSSKALEDSEYLKRFMREYRKLKNVPFDLYSQKDAKNLFRNIAESKMAIPISIYNEHKSEINEALNKISSPSKLERTKARQFIEQYTLNINVQYDKKHANACHRIKDNADYYIVDCNYDFDEDNLTGYGLEK